MSTSVKQERLQKDPRFAKRRSVLEEGRTYKTIPSSWTAQRSIEASKASRDMPASDISEYNGTFELA